MNVGRALAGVANDPIYNGPDDAAAGVVTSIATFGYGQTADYVPNHAASIVGSPEVEFQGTIVNGREEIAISLPTVYLGESPFYSSILTGLNPNQGYLKSAVIAIELGVLYSISEMNLGLDEEEKHQVIQDNVHAFLKQEKARMEQYIFDIQQQDIISSIQNEEIEVLNETIQRIGGMLTAPIIEATKSNTETVLERKTEQTETEEKGFVSSAVSGFRTEIKNVVSFKGGLTTNNDFYGKVKKVS